MRAAAKKIAEYAKRKNLSRHALAKRAAHEYPEIIRETRQRKGEGSRGEPPPVLVSQKGASVSMTLV